MSICFWILICNGPVLFTTWKVDKDDWYKQRIDINKIVDTHQELDNDTTILLYGVNPFGYEHLLFRYLLYSGNIMVAENLEQQYQYWDYIIFLNDDDNSISFKQKYFPYDVDENVIKVVNLPH